MGTCRRAGKPHGGGHAPTKSHRGALLAMQVVDAEPPGMSVACRPTSPALPLTCPGGGGGGALCLSGATWIRRLLPCSWQYSTGVGGRGWYGQARTFKRKRHGRNRWGITALAASRRDGCGTALAVKLSLEARGADPQRATHSEHCSTAKDSRLGTALDDQITSK